MKVVAFIGIGMGNPKNITVEGMAYIRNADIVIGSERIIGSFGEHLRDDIKVFKMNNTNDIICLIQNELIADNMSIAVLIAGDTGFYSEAEKMIEAFTDNPEISIKNIPGISSLSYFSSKLNLTYNNALCVDLHGEETKIVQYVVTHKKVFCLSGGDVEVLLGELVKARLTHVLSDDVRIYIGERLSYDDEKIIYSTLKDVHKHKDEIKSMSSLAVFMFENDEAVF